MRIYYDRLKAKRVLKRIPKAPKKINPRNFELGVNYANNEPASLSLGKKLRKMEINNQDFIAGINDVFKKL